MFDKLHGSSRRAAAKGNKHIISYDWRLSKEGDDDINKFIKYLQENEISNEWKTNTYQHQLSSKASMAISSIDVGKDKEIEELYEKSGLKEKDYKLQNFIFYETYKLNFGEPHQEGKVPEIKKKIIEWYNSRKEK
ncbi:MAG: hypothetical protein ABH952_06780 [Candidatus Omnitrophota bacterium]